MMLAARTLTPHSTHYRSTARVVYWRKRCQWFGQDEERSIATPRMGSLQDLEVMCS